MADDLSDLPREALALLGVKRTTGRSRSAITRYETDASTLGPQQLSARAQQPHQPAEPREKSPEKSPDKTTAHSTFEPASPSMNDAYNAALGVWVRLRLGCSSDSPLLQMLKTLGSISVLLKASAWSDL